MVIRRAPRPDTGWFVVSNQVARDSRLSYKARGLLLSLLSRPDDWQIGGARQLAHSDGPDGETAILAALRELQEAGYLHRERHRRSDGTYFITSTVYDQPQRGFPVEVEPPERGFPGQAKPGQANPGALERPKTKDPLAAQARRPIWDELDKLFGPVTNDGSRGRRAKAHKLLEQSAATPPAMRVRARLWKQRFPNAALTDIALANNWDRLVVPSGAIVVDAMLTACQRCGSRRLLGYDKAGLEVPWDDPSVVEVGQCPCIAKASA